MRGCSSARDALALLAKDVSCVRESHLDGIIHMDETLRGLRKWNGD